jgi:cytochrome c peroxidase
MSPRLGILTLIALVSWPAQAAEVPSPAEVKAAIGHLGPTPVPVDNPLTPQKAALGKALFEDTKLSGDGSLSCQSCHLPDHGFAVPQALGPAYPSQAERRNSPTLVNVAYAAPLIWDGRAGSLDKQALGPIQNILHMNANLDLLIEQLKQDPEYRRAFREAFGDDAITGERIGQALGSYERTLVFENSPLDRYMDGDESALNASQKRGLTLFMGKAGCLSCHGGPTMSDNAFHNLAVPEDNLRQPEVFAALRFDAKRMEYKDWANLDRDPGRALVTKKPEDFGRFRTMGLRNVAHTGPYMHNGAIETLKEVVEFYNRGGGSGTATSRELKPLGLTGEEVADLVAFLEATTGTQRRIAEQQ